MADFDRVMDRVIGLAELYARNKQPKQPAVVTGGGNFDNTPMSAYHKAAAAGGQQMDRYRTAAQGMEDLRRRNAMGGAGGLPGLSGQTAGQAPGLPAQFGDTPLTRNQQFNRAPMNLYGNAMQDARTEGGEGRDYWMRSGRAAPGANLADLYGGKMQPGQGVAMTEGGRAAAISPNYEYGAQQMISDPNARASLPMLAQQHNQAVRQRQFEDRARQFTELSKTYDPQSIRAALETGDLNRLQPRRNSKDFEVKTVKEYDDSGNEVTNFYRIDPATGQYMRMQAAGNAGQAAAPAPQGGAGSTAAGGGATATGDWRDIYNKIIG